ncbi:MAG: flagellar hook-associated protein FlgL [Clostridiales bacterium]|jgi:flagellar hook-associated protein 3 FlgL|nr:flagellar hook-associated protein FlgL [Eubacteriales bacterium]MDH7566170.1 flagellar hook-associated protein FlgL [Clostridiales bacterium]
MRITNNMLINNMINYIGNNLTRMEKYQRQLATGKKIAVPSDDPVVATRALKLRTDVSQVEQYQKNVKDGQSWMDVTESALSGIGDIMQRARELVVQGASSTATPDDTKKIAEEAKQLKTQLIHLANSTYAGRYIFSGYKTDKKLIIDDPNDPNFGKFNIPVSNSENIRYEIGIGDDININVPGGDLFNMGGAATVDTSGTATGNLPISSLDFTGGNTALNLTVDGEAVSINITPQVYADNNALAAEIQTQINNATATAADVSVTLVGNSLRITSGSQGDTSAVHIDSSSSAAGSLGFSSTTEVNGTSLQEGKMIKVMSDFIAALESGDHQTIGNLLGTFDENINNLLRVRADVGARQNRIDLTSNRLDNDTINFTKLMSDNEDVDMAEAIMNLKNEENVYRSSLAGGARIIQPTLVDFLK